MSSSQGQSQPGSGPPERPASDDPLAALARSEGIPSAVAAARDAADAVLIDRGLRQIPAELTGRALLAAAHASAELARDEAELAAAVATVRLTEVDPAAWTAGAARMNSELPLLAGQLRQEPGRVLARLHALACRGIVADDELGKIRPAAAGRIADLQQLLTTPTSAPALVLAAIVHAEILTLMAFGPGSGLVARAAEHCVQIAAGLDTPAVVVPEAGHLAAGPAYRRAADAYVTGGAVGVRDWIVHCTDAFAYGVEVSPAAELGRGRRPRSAR